MNPVTLIYPYYENPGMLERQLAHLAALPADLRAQVRLIVVDDGSPTQPITAAHLAAGASAGLAAFSAYRILVDVRWNWIACRNLAADRAATRWLLLTDIDHMLPAETARRLIFGELNTRKVYRFSRADLPEGAFDRGTAKIGAKDCEPYKPHPNSWLMTRKMFDRIGGYDERFSGYYGTDGEFRDRVKATAGAPIMLDDVLIRVRREVQADASTTQYGRKEEQDGVHVPRIRAERNAQPGWRPLRLTFPWEQLA